MSVQVNPKGTRRKLLVKPARGAFANRVRVRPAAKAKAKVSRPKLPGQGGGGSGGGFDLRKAMAADSSDDLMNDSDLGDLGDLGDFGDTDESVVLSPRRLPSSKKKKKKKPKPRKQKKGGANDFDEDDLMALANTDRVVERGVGGGDEKEDSSDTDDESACSGDSDGDSGDDSSDDSDNSSDSDSESGDDDDESDDDSGDDSDDSDESGDSGDGRGTGARTGVPRLAGKDVYRSKETKEYEKAKLIEQVARQMRQLGKEVDTAALESKSRRRLRLIKRRMMYQVRSQSAIQLYRRIMVFMSVMSEGLAKRYPQAFLNADLDNWSKQLFRDLDQFDPYLYDVYDEYGDRMDINPLANLAMALVSHAGMIAYANKQKQIGRSAAQEEVSRSAAAFGRADPRQAAPVQAHPPSPAMAGPTGTPRRVPISTPVPPPPQPQQAPYAPRPRVHVPVDDGRGLGDAPVPAAATGRRGVPMSRADPRMAEAAAPESPPQPQAHQGMPPPPSRPAPVQMTGPSQGADAANMLQQFKARAQVATVTAAAAPTAAEAPAAPSRRVKVSLRRKK